MLIVKKSFKIITQVIISVQPVACSYPQVTMTVFEDYIYLIIGNRMTVAGKRQKALIADSIKSKETLVGAEPYEALIILLYGINI